MLDAVLLIRGDLARERRAWVEAQMRDGGERCILDARPEIELADDPTFVAGVADPCDGGVGWDRRAGGLASQQILQFRGQA